MRLTAPPLPTPELDVILSLIVIPPPVEKRLTAPPPMLLEKLEETMLLAVMPPPTEVRVTFPPRGAPPT